MKRPSSNPSSGNGRPVTSYQSYQSGGSNLPAGYQPPIHYASDQTRTLEDTTKTYYQTDETSQQVLQTLKVQRQQLGSAHDDVWQMRQATEQAKREIIELQKKYRRKKQKLLVTIAALSMLDLLLLFRILQCRGNFFC